MTRIKDKRGRDGSDEGIVMNGTKQGKRWHPKEKQRISIDVDKNKTALPLRTTAPNPNTATVAPASTLHVLRTAPSPVATPQPNKHTFSRAASLAILAHEISASTVYSDMVLHPMKW